MDAKVGLGFSPRRPGAPCVPLGFTTGFAPGLAGFSTRLSLLIVIWSAKVG
jgi:hypothetical protein